jgi:hypothetical protein
MIQPNILNAAITLALIIGAMIGVSYLVKRLGLAPRLQTQFRLNATPADRTTIRIDRLRQLSVVQLGDCRFAILTGGRTDQLLLIERNAQLGNT